MKYWASKRRCSIIMQYAEFLRFTSSWSAILRREKGTSKFEPSVRGRVLFPKHYNNLWWENALSRKLNMEESHSLAPHYTLTDAFYSSPGIHCFVHCVCLWRTTIDVSRVSSIHCEGRLQGLRASLSISSVLHACHEYASRGQIAGNQRRRQWGTVPPWIKSAPPSQRAGPS